MMRGKRQLHIWLLSSLVIALISLAAVLTGCGGDKIRVSIKENNITTKLEVPSGQTVEEIMTLADLPLGDKDEITPSPDTSVTEDGATIDVKRYAKVSVVDEGRTSEAELVGGTVEQALEKAGVSLNKDDYTDCNPKAFLKDGMMIKVIRVRHVKLTVNGETETIATSARTVEELFKEQNIIVGKKDRLNVKVTDKIKEGMKIVLDLVSTKEETVKEDIPYETQTELSASMNQGQTSVKRAGIVGEKEVTYRVTYVNGKEEARKKLSEKVLKEPVAEIVIKGTKPTRTVTSRQKVMDCDGSGHGYWIITYSDGTTEYQEF